MQKPDKIDYTKLLGFDVVSDQLSAGVDFQGESFEARLGAKVGAEVLVACDLADNRPETSVGKISFFDA
jgi:hypothetical protein